MVVNGYQGPQASHVVADPAPGSASPPVYYPGKETTRVDQQYAGLVRRFLAFAIDAAILAGVILASNFTLGTMILLIWGEAGIPVVLLINLAYIVFYFTGFDSTESGATPGKKILHIAVSHREGGSISSGRAFVRLLAAAAHLFLPMLILASLITVIVSENKQTVFDMITDSVVEIDR